jgi:tryptophan synthase
MSEYMSEYMSENRHNNARHPPNFLSHIITPSLPLPLPSPPLPSPCSIAKCLEFVAEARSKGLTIPVVLMGYYNPFFQFGIDALATESAAAGVDGFIVVDLPPEEGYKFVNTCAEKQLSYIPLIAPTSTDKRVKYLLESASSFVYCVSVTGVTGSRTELPGDLKEFIGRIREQTDLPLAVGFGIGDPDQVNQVAEIGDGVVVGSAILNAVDRAGPDATTEERAKACKEFIQGMVKGAKQVRNAGGMERSLIYTGGTSNKRHNLQPVEYKISNNP